MPAAASTEEMNSTACCRPTTSCDWTPCPTQSGTTLSRAPHDAILFDVHRRKSHGALCQNCVTYPRKPQVNTVTYEDTSTRIDVAEVVDRNSAKAPFTHIRSEDYRLRQWCTAMVT